MKRLKNWFTQSSATREIESRAAILSRLLQILREALPTALRSHVSGCALHDRQLVVFVDQAEWATHLRFLENEILTAVSRYPEFGISGVRCRIQPVDKPDDTPSATHAISGKSRKLLQQAADNLQDDELADALRRLANSPDKTS